jgi:hypothetical protein
MGKPSQINLRIVVDGATACTDTAASAGIDWSRVIHAINAEQVPADKQILLYLAVTASLMYEIRKRG